MNSRDDLHLRMKRLQRFVLVWAIFITASTVAIVLLTIKALWKWA